MGKSNFIILRTDGEKAEPIGLRATILNSFKKADEQARALSDRYTHQTFIVCQAVAVYQVHHSSSVKALVPGPSAQHRSAKRQPETAAKQIHMGKANEKNIVEMPARKIAGKPAEGFRRKI